MIGAPMKGAKAMSDPWKGAAHPRTAGIMERAALLLRCDEAAIRAVFEAEAAGTGFLPDGTVIRRFEPHHMPGSSMTWRDSLNIPEARRALLFREAYGTDPEAALRATSWGLPQIMGFNHAAAGYESADDMVRDMADSEDAQVLAFVHLITDWELDSAIRAHDWQTFETRYNGGGQGGAYARKIEALYRKHSGRASPEVLRLGSSGAAVREVQAALGVPVDGRFGPETDAAVRAFQEREGLPVDGIVGRRTWDALKARGTAAPTVQPTSVDRAISQAVDVLVKAGSGAGAGALGAKALDRAPAGALDLLWYGGSVLVLLVAALVLVRWFRRAAL